MGIRCTFMCDRCGLKEETIHRDNYFGTIKQYEAETWLCEKCRNGVRKAIQDYIHGTGPYHHMNKESE